MYPWNCLIVILLVTPNGLKSCILRNPDHMLMSLHGFLHVYKNMHMCYGFYTVKRQFYTFCMVYIRGFASCCLVYLCFIIQMC